MIKKTARYKMIGTCFIGCGCFTCFSTWWHTGTMPCNTWRPVWLYRDCYLKLNSSGQVRAHITKTGCHVIRRVLISIKFRTHSQSMEELHLIETRSKFSDQWMKLWRLNMTPYPKLIKGFSSYTFWWQPLLLASLSYNTTSIRHSKTLRLHHGYALYFS